MAIGTITSVSADDSAGDVLGNASDDELGIEEIDDLESDDSENAEFRQILWRSCRIAC